MCARSLSVSRRRSALSVASPRTASVVAAVVADVVVVVAAVVAVAEVADAVAEVTAAQVGRGGGEPKLKVPVPVPLARRLRRLARVAFARRGLRERVQLRARQRARVAVPQHELGEHPAAVYAHRMVRTFVREPPVGHLCRGHDVGDGSTNVRVRYETTRGGSESPPSPARFGVWAKKKIVCRQKHFWRRLFFFFAHKINTGNANTQYKNNRAKISKGPVVDPSTRLPAFPLNPPPV